MKSYLLKPSQEKKLGDKTEQHYLVEYSETETQALETDLGAFLKEQMKKFGDPLRPDRIDIGSVREKLNLAAATNRADIQGLFQMVGGETN